MLIVSNYKLKFQMIAYNASQYCGMIIILLDISDFSPKAFYSSILFLLKHSDVRLICKISEYYLHCSNVSSKDKTKRNSYNHIFLHKYLFYI